MHGITSLCKSPGSPRQCRKAALAEGILPPRLAHETSGCPELLVERSDWECREWRRENAAYQANRNFSKKLDIKNRNFRKFSQIFFQKPWPPQWHAGLETPEAPRFPRKMPFMRTFLPGGEGTRGYTRATPTQP